MPTGPADVPGYRHLLAATDGSAHAEHAVAHAAGLAAQLHAQVTILTVVEPFHSLGARAGAFSHLPDIARRQALELLNADAQAALDQALAITRRDGVDAEGILVEGEPVDQVILDTARSVGAELIVMGSHGRRGLAAVVMGSVAQKVVTSGSVPVLIVR